MVRLHARLRRLGWKWPSIARWQTWAKNRRNAGAFAGLSAQSVQQTVMQFVECLNATTAARKAERSRGAEPTAKYPSRERRYRTVTYTNQGAVIRDGFLRLSHGRDSDGRSLYLRIKLSRELSGRVMQVTLGYGVVRIVCEVPDVAPVASVTVGVDLGVNTLIAATDGVTAVLVSGREAKAIVQFRNKRLASVRSRVDRCKPGSRRQKRLNRRKRKMLAKCGRKIRDITHKATRAVANAFPNARVIVGKPFNDAARKMGRVQAQQVSQACNGKIIAQLAYKTAGVEQVSEAYSSQSCPACECRQKCRRVYQCAQCKLRAPRDVVGSVNIRAIGLYGRLMPAQPMPTRVVFQRPLRKYRGGGSPPPRSSGGTPASSSVAA